MSFPNGYTIQFRHTTNYKDIVETLRKCSKWVTHIEFSNCVIPPNLSFILDLCQQVESLKLYGCQFNGDLDLSPLGECKNLKILCINGYHKGTLIQNIGCLQWCPKLHTVYVCGCTIRTPASGLGQCPSLNELNLSGCKGVTGVGDLGDSTTLHTVVLIGTGVTDVSSLEKRCKSLETLDIV